VTTDEISVPAKQGLGLDEEPVTLGPQQQADQSGEQCPIGWAERRPRYLATQDCDLVAEDDDLDGQVRSVAALQSEEGEGPDERQIEKGQRHHQPSSFNRPRAMLLLRSYGRHFRHPQARDHRRGRRGAR
jgi:hypothetical protein